jgi:5-methylthioribose kinase
VTAVDAPYELLERVWRAALTDGERHDRAAGKMRRHVARVAFRTSLLGVEPAAAGELEHAFMTRAEALIHGDLHTEAARRVAGLAHVPDLETLEPDARAGAGRSVIATVRRLLLERPDSAAAVRAVARERVARG